MSDTLLAIPATGIASSTVQQPYTHYSYSYTATLSQTYLTFQFRQDPAYWGLDDIAVTATGGGANLVSNGGFENGLSGWTLIGTQGLTAAGNVSAGTPGTTPSHSHSGSRYFYDGAVGGVDGIYQSFSTVIGHAYTVDFWLANDGSGGAALALVEIGSKNGAYANDASAPNGIGVLADGSTLPDGNIVTSAAQPTVTGHADAGSVVAVTLDGLAVGSATADADGVWSLALPGPLTDGSHALGAAAHVGAGTPSSTTTVSLTVDTTAPSAPGAPALAAASDTGTPGDGITGLATPTLTGTAEAGSTVRVYNGTTLIGTAVADAATGAWTVVPTVALAEGANELHATATDALGNVSAPSDLGVVRLDTTSPAPGAAPSLASSPGAVATGSTTPAFAGTGEPGGLVTLYDGDTVIGSAVADATTGAWTVTPAGPLAEGAHTLTFTVTDATGNVSIPSAAATLFVDLTGPSATGVATDPGAGTVTTGQVVRLFVLFDEPVSVAGGVPALSLNNGALATFDGAASSPTTLVFAYTVQPGDDVADLAVTGVVLDGATFADAAGNAANLAGAVAAPDGTLQVNTGYHPFVDLVASNADPAAVVTVTAAVRPATAGMYGNLGTGTMADDGLTYTVTGLVADVNAALAGVLLSPAPGQPVSTGLSASISDADGSGISRLLNSGAQESALDTTTFGDEVSAGSGGDTLTDRAGGGTLLGGGGRDTMVGHEAGSSMIGGTGDSAFTSRGGHTFIAGGGHADTVSAALGDVTVVSAMGGRTLVGLGEGPALVNGRGTDTITGGAGSATVFAGAGSTVVLGSGDAVVSAETGSTVSGGGGNTLVAVRGAGVTFFAGTGHTTFIGGTGSSTVSGGTGSGQLLLAGEGGGILGSGTGGHNVVVGGRMATTIFGGGDGDVLFAMGSAGTVVKAGSGNETLQGGYSSGRDTFFAGSGRNLIGLGTGEDTVVAGTGSATVVAGTARDTFSFVNGQAGGTEVILGFKAGVDRLHLHGYAAGEFGRALSHASYTTGSASQAGGATLTLSDNTHIVFTNLTTLSATTFG